MNQVLYKFSFQSFYYIQLGMAWEQVLGIDFAIAQKSMREEIPQRGYKVNGGPIVLLFSPISSFM